MFVYLKSPRRKRKKTKVLQRNIKSIVVYLKSPRRRREKAKVLQRNIKVPHHPHHPHPPHPPHHNPFLKQERGGRRKAKVLQRNVKSIVVYLKWPRRRREKILKIRSTTAQYKKHRCVPKMASPETHESEYTTALQGHRSQEFGLCSLVRRRRRSRRSRRTMRRRKEERGTLLKNRTSHKG